MSRFEVLTLLIALLAVVPGLIALMRASQQRTRIDELEAAQLRQNRATAELHEKQLELLVTNERKPIAHVKLDLVRDGRTYRFQVTNLGPARATDVSVRFDGDGGANPVVEQDYQAKFPAPIIEPGSTIAFLAAIYLDSPSSFNAVVSWTNPDGSRVDETAYVTL
ncbi:MAG TPA: hypothetical protein VM687_05305 [Stenotrophomonas sp.]|nr:hypothetical protein [Stenotrophomonas sp.]